MASTTKLISQCGASEKDTAASLSPITKKPPIYATIYVRLDMWMNWDQQKNTVPLVTSIKQGVSSAMKTEVCAANAGDTTN